MMSLMSRRCSVSSSAAKCARVCTRSTSHCPARPRWTSLTVTLERQIILLVSDINMPGMTGLELLHVVKQRRPDLPVFMISAYGDQNTIATALARGADKFLTKPVDFPQLKRDITAICPQA